MVQTAPTPAAVRRVYTIRSFLVVMTEVKSEGYWAAYSPDIKGLAETGTTEEQVHQLMKAGVEEAIDAFAQQD